MSATPIAAAWLELEGAWSKLPPEVARVVRFFFYSGAMAALHEVMAASKAGAPQVQTVVDAMIAEGVAIAPEMRP